MLSVALETDREEGDENRDGLAEAALGSDLPAIPAHLERLGGYLHYMPPELAADGTMVLALTTHRECILLDCGNRKIAKQLPLPPFGEPVAIAILPSARLVAVGRPRRKLWSTTTKQKLCALGPHYEEMGGVAFSPDGLQLATASSDATVGLWSVPDGRLRARLRGEKLADLRLQRGSEVGQPVSNLPGYAFTHDDDQTFPQAQSRPLPASPSSRRLGPGLCARNHPIAPRAAATARGPARASRDH